MPVLKSVTDEGVGLPKLLIPVRTRAGVVVGLWLSAQDPYGKEKPKTNQSPVRNREQTLVDSELPPHQTSRNAKGYTRQSGRPLIKLQFGRPNIRSSVT